MEGRHNGRLGSNDSSILATKREVADRNEGISSHVCTAKEWERSVGSHKVKPRMSTMKDTKCLCRVMWPEVHGDERATKVYVPVLSASRNLRLFSILQSVGAPKTTTALPSASVAQLLSASAANSSTSESSE
jgi:hypothetical protein